MKYSKTIGDICEIYEGEPEHIADLMMRMPETIGLQAGAPMIDEEELIDYITGKSLMSAMQITREEVAKILDLQLEYMKKIGLVE